MSINRLNGTQRAAAYKAVVKEVESIEKRHGADVVRWALNKLHKERQDRRRIAKEKARLEAELAKLGSI